MVDLPAHATMLPVSTVSSRYGGVENRPRHMLHGQSVMVGFDFGCAFPS